MSILSHLKYEPTPDQAKAASLLEEFLSDPCQTKAFLLKGYAGTGKTTLLSALVNTLRKTVLLAPTGRAAKVFASYSGHQAYSIHKYIYRQQASGSARFELDVNNNTNTLFIIDESSMIPNLPTENDVFGSGRVLDDLIEYIYSGENCQAIFLGDTAQLLPVGMQHSPALERQTLEGYGLKVTECTLKDVVRQTFDSGILSNATRLRQALAQEEFTLPPLTCNHNDVIRVSGEDLIESINSSYNEVGEEDTAILTYSNRRAVQYNRGIRNQVLYREERIQSGDLLMVTKNNYFWNKPYKDLPFIANGEIAEVRRVGKQYGFYDATFAELTLRLLDYDTEITALALIDSLEAETPAAMNSLTERVNNAIIADYADIHNKAELWKTLKNDRFFNALQIKFAYAITTHKSQGGAWRHIYIDFGYTTEDMIDRQYCQWLYTAVTRAKGKLFFVNFPDRIFENNKQLQQ